MADDDEETDFEPFAASVGVSLVCGSIMGFYLWRYNLARESMAIHIRHPDLAMLSQIILLVFVVIQRPLASVIWTWRQPPKDGADGLIVVSDLIFSTCYFGNLLALAWRIFWLNFDMNTYREGMGIKWQHFINPMTDDSAKQRESDIKTKGNFRWCLIRYSISVTVCVIIFTVLGVPELTLNHAEDERDYYIMEMSWLLLVSTIVAMYTVVLWNDLPHDDLKYLYFVKAELRFLLWTMLGGWLICICGIPIGGKPSTLHWRIFFDIVPTLIALVLSMVQSWYVLWVNGIKVRNKRQAKRLQKAEKVDYQFKQDKQRFIDAMQNDATFDLYVAHLQKEFSLENLLCAMEYRQLATLVLSADVWQNDYSREGNISRSKFLARHDHDFYRKAPPSAIVKSEGVSFEAKVSQLYQKYISSSALMQVNLPSSLRQRWELFHVSFCDEINHDPNQDVTTVVHQLAEDLRADMQDVMASPGNTTAGNTQGGYTPGDEHYTPRADDEVELDEHGYLVWLYDDADGNADRQLASDNHVFAAGQSRMVDMQQSHEFEKQYYLQVLTLIDMTIREAYKLMSDSYTRFNEGTTASERLTENYKRNR